MHDAPVPSTASSELPLSTTARNARGPVFVALWTPRCGACLATEERLKQFERHVNVTLERINVARAPEIAETVDVDSVPTLLVFQDGRLHKRLAGAETIQAFIDRVGEAMGE